MPHKTVIGKSNDAGRFAGDADDLIKRALGNMSGRDLTVTAVTVTPLSVVGGWPFQFAVTVVAEERAP